MSNQVWAVRTEENGLDHYYEVKGMRLLTMCGLIINSETQWFQFHTTQHHVESCNLLPPLVDSLGLEKHPKVPINMCEICNESLERLDILKELGE